MQALPRPLRSKMSLAGKMLHSIHMRTWGEIAKRRSQLKEMDSWRCITQMCNWRAQSDKGPKGSGAGQHGQDNSTQTQKQQKHCIIWRVSSFLPDSFQESRRSLLESLSREVGVHYPNLLRNISPSFAGRPLRRVHCWGRHHEVDPWKVRRAVGLWPERKH